VTRRLALLLAFIGLAAGCGSIADRPSAPAKPGPDGGATTPTTPRSTGAIVRVTIVNGDTLRRVSGARVVIGRRRALTGARGMARFRLARRRALPVTVTAPRFGARTLRMPFQRHRLVTIRIYQPELQWRMYGVTPTRTQTQDRLRIRPPFRVVWSRGIGSLIEFPAVVADNVAYIGNFHGTVRAISMRSGKVVWRRDTPGGKMAASPAVVGRTLVVHGMDGHVWLLDRRNGRLLWRFTVGSPIESSPVVAGGVDYFGAWNGTVYALDLKRRRLRWTFHSGYKITSSAALSGATAFIGDYRGRLLALSARTGRLRWSGSVNGRIYGTPALAGGRVFVPSSDGGSLTAFSRSGSYLWRLNLGAYVYSSPAVWRGRVFFGSYNGSFYCVSARSGSVLWRVGLGGPISGAAVVVDGVAYAGSFAHRIVGVAAGTGRVLVTFPHGMYVPVSGNDLRLLFHGYSRLYAVEPKRRR
jgi:outer membrane protein assembly factor BamB